MKIPLTRLVLATSAGLASGIHTWNELVTAPRTARRCKTYGAIIQLVFPILWAAGFMPSAQPRPVRSARDRVSSAVMAVMTLVNMARALRYLATRSQEEQRSYEEWREQKKRYRRFVRRWKRRDGLGDLKVWQELVQRRTLELPLNWRIAFYTLAYVRGLADAVSTYRRLSMTSGGQKVTLYLSYPLGLAGELLHNAGILPSRLWIPRPVRIAAFAAFAPILAVTFVFLVVFHLRQALMSPKEWQRHYERAQELQQQMEAGKLEQEQREEHTSRPSWRQFWR